MFYIYHWKHRLSNTIKVLCWSLKKSICVSSVVQAPLEADHLPKMCFSSDGHLHYTQKYAEDAASIPAVTSAKNFRFTPK